MRASGLALALIFAAGIASAVYLLAGSGVVDLSSLWPEEKVYPSPNWQGKTDRIALTTVASKFTFDDPANDPGEPLRQSFAAIDALTGIRRGETVKPPTLDAITVAPPILPRPRPKSIVRRQQSSYTLVSDLQIDAIKNRLKLTAAQEAAWPPVEEALRALAQRVGDARRSGGGIASSEEVAQFRAAAGPFLAKLSGDQKRELKMLAHLIGLGTVVAML